MKKINKFACGLLCAGALSVSGFANAGVVEFTGLTASWINIDPASIVASGNGTDTASMEWGTPANAQNLQSGYVFQTALTPFQVVLPPSPSAAFELGTWTHHNNPITGTSLSSATLQLDAAIEVDGTSVGTKSFFFDFTHNETTNSANPCENGDANNVGNNINGCADIVTVAANSLSESFLVNGDLYTLNVQSASSYFETIEEQSNSFDIKGVLELDTRNVSEPGTLALLGLGLAGLGVRLRRKSA